MTMQPSSAATWPPWACPASARATTTASASASASPSCSTPPRAHIIGTPGEFAWGGAASTAFWIDPVKEQLAVVFLTQLTPSSTYPVRRELRVLTYAAIVD